MKKVILLLILCLSIGTASAGSPTVVADTTVANTVSVSDSLTSAQQPVKKNPYKAILAKRTINFSFGAISRGVLGMAVLLLIAWLASYDRRKINWKTVFIALAFQLLLAISVLLFSSSAERL